MRQGQLLGIGGLLAATSACVLVFLLLNHQFDLDLPAPTGHFWVVSPVALACLGLAIPAAIATLRKPDTAQLAVTLAFLSIAGFFSVHGLATPGFLLDAVPPGSHQAHAGGYGQVLPADAYSDPYGDEPAGPTAATPNEIGGGPAPTPSKYADVVGLSARLAMVFGALFLAAGVVRWPQRFDRAFIRRPRVAISLWSTAMIAYALIGLVLPQYLPPDVLKRQSVLNVTLLVVVAAALLAAVRYFQAYRLSNSSVHGAAALASLLMLEAQIGMHFGEVWYVSWWLYHFQLLGGFGALVASVTLEHARGGGAVAALEQLSARDALSQIEAGFSQSVHTLAASLEIRDPYTHGHGRRVAGLAYYAGQNLKFPPRRLRAVVQGALLHDVGKIGIPDNVLLKPGTLTADEFELIKGHPCAGERLLSISRPGAIELAIIRHHHERFDGSGYPDGLRGPAIPLEARLVAVADVYDALRSNRAYRVAWTRERTTWLLRKEAGTHFDPECVEAVLQAVDVFEREFEPETTWQRSVAPVSADLGLDAA